MKKWNRQKLGYWFERMMSRGTAAMIVLLFAVTMLAVVLIGIPAYWVADEGGLGYQLWMSLMHTLDAGTLAGNGTANIPYLILMSLATLCGLFVTSILIGVISTGIEDKLDSLRKGRATAT